jgi:hypothetical protein
MKKTQPQVVATATPKPAGVEVPKVVTFTRSTKERRGTSVVFLIPGVRGTVKVARLAFDAEPPATLEPRRAALRATRREDEGGTRRRSCGDDAVAESAGRSCACGPCRSTRSKPPRSSSHRSTFQASQIIGRLFSFRAMISASRLRPFFQS